MTHELRNLLVGRSSPEQGLLELQEGKWWDSHASGLRLLPKNVALANRAALERGMATIRQAKVVLMTLGMTESWIDPGNRSGDEFEPWGSISKKK